MLVSSATLAFGRDPVEKRTPADLWGLPREEDDSPYGSVGRKPLVTCAVEALRLTDLIVMPRWYRTSSSAVRKEPEEFA
jgi:hypothetical protein